MKGRTEGVSCQNLNGRVLRPAMPADALFAVAEGHVSISVNNTPLRVYARPRTHLAEGLQGSSNTKNTRNKRKRNRRGRKAVSALRGTVFCFLSQSCAAQMRVGRGMRVGHGAKRRCQLGAKRGQKLEDRVGVNSMTTASLPGGFDGRMRKGHL